MRKQCNLRQRLFLVAFVVLSGCAGTTVNEMVSAPRNTAVFIAKESYQQATVILKEVIEQEMDIAPGVTVYSDLSYSELFVKNMDWIAIYAKVEKVSEGQSRVSIYQRGVDKKAVRLVEKAEGYFKK